MNNSSNCDLKHSKISKQLWEIAGKHLVIIDESIIQKLGIKDDSITFVEQDIIEDGIVMRIKKLND